MPAPLSPRRPQPRIGARGYASLVETSIAERFRIVSNADVAPNVPPNAADLANPSYVLPVLAEHGVDVFLGQSPWTTQASRGTLGPPPPALI